MNQEDVILVENGWLLTNHYLNLFLDNDFLGN